MESEEYPIEEQATVDENSNGHSEAPKDVSQETVKNYSVEDFLQKVYCFGNMVEHCEQWGKYIDLSFPPLPPEKMEITLSPFDPVLQADRFVEFILETENHLQLKIFYHQIESFFKNYLPVLFLVSICIFIFRLRILWILLTMN